MTKRHFALVVGMNSYPEAAGQDELRGAVNDACDFAEWALASDGGKVEPGDLYFWTHPWPDNPPELLARAIEDGIADWDLIDLSKGPPSQLRGPQTREIVQTIQARGRAQHDGRYENGAGVAEEAILYIFFAGHGMRAKDPASEAEPQTCLITSEFRPYDGAAQTYGILPCDDLRRTLREERFEHVIMFLDCCRNTVTGREHVPDSVGDLSRSSDAQNWGAGHATLENELAFETTIEPIRGAFSKVLMSGLRGYRGARTQSLDMEMLQGFVKVNFKNEPGRRQQPSFEYKPQNQPLIIVEGPPQIMLKPGPKIEFAPEVHGKTYVLIDGDLEVVDAVGELIAGPEAIEILPLPSGLYSLEEKDRQEGNQSAPVPFRHPGTELIHVG